MNAVRCLVPVIALLGLFALPAVSQVQEEDVVVLKDGRVFRGTVANKVTPGGSVSLSTADSKVVTLYWEELAVVRRVPAGIPDSILILSFLPAQGRYAGPPRIDLAGYERSEDVVFTRDGALRRGIILHDGKRGWVGLWSEGSLAQLPHASVIRSVHVDRGIPDSMLIMTHIAPPVAWTEGERRYLSVFGGFTMPVMGEQKIEDADSRDLDTAPVAGVEVGVRIARGLRWLTGATYSSHGHGSIGSIAAIDGATGPDMKARIISVLTGLELRSIGPSLFQYRVFAQGGILMVSEQGYRISFPQTYYHLKGEATVDDASASAFGASMGCGLLAGWFTVDLRWIISKVSLATHTTIHYQYGDPRTLESADGRVLNLFMITAGFSPF